MELESINGLKAVEFVSRGFAEWLAENHYTLCNVSNNIYYWKSESDNNIERTTKELYNMFLD